MKVAIINDSHWGFKRSNKVFEEHIASFFDFFLENLKKQNINTVIHLGDFFDVRTNINLITLNCVKERFLEPMLKSNIEMHIVPGNHDCSYRHSLESNSVSLLFDSYPNINVYEKPTIVDFEDKSNILLVPWIGKDDEKEFIDIIDSCSLKTKTCAGHFEFLGFVYQKGVVSTDGMNSEVFTPKFDIILSGHYHSKSTRGNVHYLGTQYDLTWSDYDDEKFFHIFDTESLELVPVKNENRMFHKIFYNEELLDGNFAELDGLNFKDKIVKVVVLKRKNMVQFDTMMDKIYSTSPYDVSVVDESIVSAQKQMKVDTSLLTKTTMDIINEMIDDIDLGDYNKDKIKSNMSNFFMEAQS